MLTLDQWLEHFEKNVAPKHKWEMNRWGVLRTGPEDHPEYKGSQYSFCPLAVEDRIYNSDCLKASKKELSDLDIRRVMYSADRVFGDPEYQPELRKRLLRACGLEERKGLAEESSSSPEGKEGV